MILNFLNIIYVVNMDKMKDYLAEFDNCLQIEKPFCQSKCPWNIDILSFIKKVREGSFNAAYKILQNSVGFPMIATSICGESCAEECPLGKSINLLQIERAVIENATNKKPTRYSLPPKKEKVAIIGAGISGLSCALNLSEKKYDVVVFEKEDRIGGSLWDVINCDIFMGEFEDYKITESIKILTGREIASTTQISEFDAVYVATGNKGNDFGVLEKSSGKTGAMIGNTAFFVGGSLLGFSKDRSSAYGLHMGKVIDDYFKTKKLEVRERNSETRLVLDLTHLDADTKFSNDNSEELTNTKEEAIKEANRCIMCQCDACKIHCDLLAYLNKWPIRIKDEIIATTLPGKSEVKRTPARRTISMCTQCGLCRETCPQNIDLDNYIFEARKRLHDQDKMPWAFHDYWIRDMKFSNERAFLCRCAKSGQNKYAFFPGCQFGAISPDTVVAAYEYLINHERDIGLLIACCGVPAEWAGNTEVVEANNSIIRKAWIEMGRPKLILTCPTCEMRLKKNLPEIETVFIYELIEKWKGYIEIEDDTIWSIFDPCSSYGENKLRSDIRKIAVGMGIDLEALPMQEKYSACCGFGGHGEIADPKFSKFIIDRRINESERPFLTYCINCRDNFSNAGKQTAHLLELIFGIEQKKYTVSEKRRNRLALKKYMLKRFWNEENESEMKANSLIYISEELAQKLDSEKILEEDMEAVILFCERTGRKLYNHQTECYIGYKMIGKMTYWVEYKLVCDTDIYRYELINGYQHRMHIEMETIWNGEKIEQFK